MRATLRVTLQRAGTPPGNLDTLIAAHAVAPGCAPVTNDRALGRVPRLVVEHRSAA